MWRPRTPSWTASLPPTEDRPVTNGLGAGNPGGPSGRIRGAGPCQRCPVEPEPVLEVAGDSDDHPSPVEPGQVAQAASGNPLPE